MKATAVAAIAPVIAALHENGVWLASGVIAGTTSTSRSIIAVSITGPPSRNFSGPRAGRASCGFLTHAQQSSRCFVPLARRPETSARLGAPRPVGAKNFLSGFRLVEVHQNAFMSEQPANLPALAVHGSTH